MNCAADMENTPHMRAEKQKVISKKKITQKIEKNLKKGVDILIHVW